MFKKTFLFATTILAATSVSTGYGAIDFLKGTVSPASFLDFFNKAEKYAVVNGLIILDLIPILFLIIQAVIFFKNKKKIKTLFTALSILANGIGVFVLIQYAHPIASQIAGWTPENLPSDWISLKENWLEYIGLYALTGVIGWLFFVITYFISERKKTATLRLPRYLNFLKNTLLFLLTFILGMGAARLYDFIFFPYMYEITGTTFIEMHRPLDLAIRKVGPVLFAFIVSLHVLLASLLFIEKSKYKAWLIIGSLVFLLCDTFIALQGNGPINDLFLTWTPATIPANWAIIRNEWLSYHLYRNVFMLFGIVVILLTYFVKKDKNPIPSRQR